MLWIAVGFGGLNGFGLGCGLRVGRIRVSQVRGKRWLDDGVGNLGVDESLRQPPLIGQAPGKRRGCGLGVIVIDLEHMLHLTDVIIGPALFEQQREIDKVSAQRRGRTYPRSQEQDLVFEGRRLGGERDFAPPILARAGVKVFGPPLSDQARGVGYPRGQPFASLQGISAHGYCDVGRAGRLKED
ncbi:MAG: hypothetical protein JJU19_01885 [Pararhodobacter sp.]|nr:hypothetical protein [Pararhodobacter sp.]